MIYYFLEFSFVLNNVVKDVAESAARFSRYLPDVWVGDCFSIHRDVRLCRVSIHYSTAKPAAQLRSD